MKKTVFLLVSLFLMVLATQQINAQTASATKEASAYATIITPISIEKVQDLYFGNIVAGTGSGTVKVTTDDLRTKTGDVILPAATPGTIQAAKFTVNGLADATYSITLPASIEISLSGASPMLVSDFTSNPNGTGILTAGTQTLAVGATLKVNGGQAAGTYAGTFDVTVAYN
jgi:hypothetical protein